MVQVYHDSDADLRALYDRTVAIIGYGNQGRSQALNMRDSGIRVVVGSRPGESFQRASDDHFNVMSISEAVQTGDIVSLLVPDEVQPPVFQRDIGPFLRSGQALNFAHGYNIHYGLIEPPEDIDVIMVAPRMIGVGVREIFVAGSGAPAFIAVQQDATGQAWPTVLSLAKAIGATRTGAFRTTFAEETEVDLFTEQTFWPVITRVLRLAYEVLVARGYQPEIALLELYASGEPGEVLHGMAENGLFRQLSRHSRTSQFGTLSRGPQMLPDAYKEELNSRLEEIRSGAFAAEWTADQGADYVRFRQLKEAALAHPINAVEDRVRQLLKTQHSD